MKKLSYLIVLALILGLVLTGCLLSNVGQVPTNEQNGVSYVTKSPIMNYDNVTLTGGFQAGHFPEVWDLTTCDMIISFTYDANGLVDDFGGDAHAWAELGIRQVGYGDFNPTWLVEGAGVWLATDYDWTANTFDPDVSPTLDLDDKLILQKGGGWGEGSYNLPSPPPVPWNNHRVWWDRDDVDPWQNDETANTGGTYEVVITLHANDATSGTAYMNINGLDQGFETDGNWNTIELTPAGMTFTGDMTKMQVFYGLYGYGATHSVSFNNISVDGCLFTYNFIGSLPPVDNLPIFNVAKAGSAIPVKFSLSGYQGLDIFAAGYPKSISIQCDGTEPGEAIDTVTAGGSSLNYDDATDQYIYVWKTDKKWAGTCRQLEVKLDDGTSHFANFTFR